MKAIELVRKYLSDELILRKPIEKLHAKLRTLLRLVETCNEELTTSCNMQAARLNFAST